MSRMRTSRSHTPASRRRHTSRSLSRGGLPTPRKTPRKPRSRHRTASRRRTSAPARLARALSRSLSSHSSQAMKNEVVHGTFDRTFLPIALPSRIKKGVSKIYHGAWRYYDQFFGKITSVEGQQNANIIGKFGFYGDLMTGGVGASSNPYNTGTQFATKQSMFDLNPYQKVTGSNYYTTGTVPNADFIYLDNLKLHYEFANGQNTAAILDIYVILQKKAMFTSPITGWTLALEKEGLAPDTAADANAATGFLGAYTAPTQGWGQYTDVGRRPIEMVEWKKMYKVLAHRKFDMAADTNLLLDIDIKVNQVLDKAYLQWQYQNLGNNSSACYPGTTVFIMAVQRGQVVVDTAASGHPPSISSSDIGFCATREYTCRAASTNRIHTRTSVPYLIAGESNAQTLFNNVVDAAVQVADAFA